MSELLPCPFCGSNDVRIADVCSITFIGNCMNCGTSCGCKDTEEEAIAAWNTRAERTCQIGYERHCSNCGAYVRDDAVLVRKDLDDGAWTVVSKPVSYCPNCGAKVVKSVENSD